MNCPRTTRKAITGPISRIEVVRRADELPSAWHERIPAHHSLLSEPWLTAAIAALPAGSFARIVIGWEGETIVAAALFEALPLRIGMLGQLESEAAWPLRAALQVLTCVHLGTPHVLVCGDVLRTDVSGFWAAPSLDRRAEYLDRMTEAARRSLPVPIGMVICTSRSLGTDADALLALGYHRVDKAEPPMRLDLPPHWSSWNDYIAAMRPKYRQRAKSARKKGKQLVRQALDLATLIEMEPVLNQLLQGVLERAAVALSPPTARTLIQLKTSLVDRCQVRLYTLDGVPVGFAASLLEYDAVEGILVGFDETVNREHKLYQNMLYDYVEEALQRGVSKVCLGRSALEIKSAIGAEPHDVPVYIRHPSALLHPVIGWAASTLPTPSWIPRNPFHEDTAEEAAAR